MEPGATQHQDIDAAIVVVVGLHDIESADDALQSGPLGHPGKCPVAVVVEVLELIADAHVRDHEVEMAVVVEVFQDDTTRSSKFVDASGDCDIAELTDVVV